MLDANTRREIEETLTALVNEKEQTRVRWVRRLDNGLYEGEMSAKSLFSIAAHDWVWELWDYIQELEAQNRESEARRCEH